VADALEAFGEQLAVYDGRLHVADSLDAARERARELIGEATVAGWEDDTLTGIAAATAPAEDAEVSLIAADAGVVETGQIAFVHRAGRTRGAGVLPERQVALLDASDVVQSLAEALERLFAGGVPGNVVLVAGPSRTADIEQRSIRGVHAPRELDVIVYRSG
jgi:L-lactate dehydrogenase complex protein LldG